MNSLARICLFCIIVSLLLIKSCTLIWCVCSLLDFLHAVFRVHRCERHFSLERYYLEHGSLEKSTVVSFSFTSLRCSLDKHGLLRFNVGVQCTETHAFEFHKSPT
jgi:hypothetical protein